MIDEDFARRQAADAIQFERHLSAAPARVWRALTTADGLAEWLADGATVDLRVDGAFSVQLNADVQMTGTILALEHERQLVIAWRELEAGELTDHASSDDRTSELRFDLSPEAGGGTLLVLTHRLIQPGDSMIGFGAGWHAYLDALAAAMSGAAAVDIGERYHALRPAYDARLGETATA